MTRLGEERLIEWRNTVLQDADRRVTGTFSSGSGHHRSGIGSPRRCERPKAPRRAALYGHRYRRRHDAGGTGATVRAVLHHQRARQGHRARPGDRPWHRRAERRVRSTSSATSARARLQGVLPERGSRRTASTGGRRCPAARWPETVLVVDDAAGLRELTRRLLERLGYTVLIAANADEALRLFEQNAVHRRAADRCRDAGRAAGRS